MLCRITMVLCVVGLGLAGCPARYADGPAASNRIRSGHAPTPFSAEELQKGCGEGVWRLYRVTVPGKADSYRILRFEKVSPGGAIVVSAMTDMKGKPFGEQRRLKALWKGLQAHGSFPAKATSIQSVKRTTPAGTFDCWRYEVRQGNERKRLWFAKSIPGPPVDLIRWVGGKKIMHMTLVGHGRARPKPVPAKE